MENYRLGGQRADAPLTNHRIKDEAMDQTDKPNSGINIQWYPGHMTKTKRMLAENISLVDIVIELLDARIPFSSKNPDIEPIISSKRRIVALNKADLADKLVTAKWLEYYAAKGAAPVACECLSGKGLEQIMKQAVSLMQPKIDSLRAKGRISYTIRAMIIGVPNVGKSTLINKYAGRGSAKTADRPGVTRGKQWIHVNKEFELLDTPGILWPRFDDKRVGQNLAFCGSVNDEILDLAELAVEFISRIRTKYSDAVKVRYGIDFDDSIPPAEVLERIAEKRGFLQKGGKLDIGRAAIILLDEFRGGKLGRLSLESPEDIRVIAD